MDTLTLTQSLIKFPSVTPEEAGCLDFIESVLKPAGFECQRVPFESPGEVRVDNLYAKWGEGAPHFMFAGHVDVVPVGDEKAWEADPFGPVIKDGYLYGRGAEDMKGAIAAFMVAALAQASAKPKGSISLLLTCDEEGRAINGTRKLVPWLKEKNEIPMLCLVGEPTNPDYIGQMVKPGRRGSFYGVLTVRGKQGHVAYPARADNPITRMSHILHALKNHALDKGTEWFPASNLEVTSVDTNNAAANVIPASITAKFSIRYNTEHSAASLEKWLHDVIKKHAEDYTLEVRNSGDPFLTKPGKWSDLVLGAIHEVTGHTPELSTSGGTSDARFIKDICPVLEFGTTNHTPHQVNERVKVEDLMLLERCYAEILKRFFTQ